MNPTFPPTADELLETFNLLEDGEERYEYLIELGRQLPALPESELLDCNKVRGCLSTVWLITEVEASQPPILTVRADSDSLIVRGLIVVVLAYFSGLDCQTILQRDGEAILKELGFGDSLSMNRRNGLAAMIKRIKTDALQAMHQ